MITITEGAHRNKLTGVEAGNPSLLRRRAEELKIISKNWVILDPNGAK